MSNADLGRAVVAEAVGTMLLLATIVGSGIMASELAEGHGALALLCNAIATGAMLVVLILVFAPVSGAHFNPAVTLAFGLRRELNLSRSAAYVTAQCFGAVAGVWLAHIMFQVDVLQFGQTVRGGWAQGIAEIVATFGLVMTILSCVSRGAAIVAPAVGFYIVAAYWFTSSTSFANPAVTLARSLTDSFAGVRPADTPGFLLAQFAGAVMATGFAAYLAKPVTASRC